MIGAATELPSLALSQSPPKFGGPERDARIAADLPTGQIITDPTGIESLSDILPLREEEE